MVGIDIGWRSEAGGVRLGAWSDGERAEHIRIDASLVAQIDKADSLREIRDRAFNGARAALASWLADADVPEWMRLRVAHIGKWKSPARMAGMVRAWARMRFDGDAEAYGAAEAWRYQDHHLWEWETSQRTKSLRHRREVYRVFAAGLARRYRTLVLEDLDLAKLARSATSGGRRFDAAPGELRGALVNAFGPARVVKVPGEFTTKACHACGTVEAWDDPSAVMHTCGACGATWDRDHNAAKNIVALGGARLRDAETTGVARTDGNASNSAPMAGGRWAKAKRAKAERIAAEGVAREEGAEAAE
jgi:hypothetical protein